MRISIDRHYEALAAVGWNIQQYAPRAKSTMSREKYIQVSRFHDLVMSITRPSQSDSYLREPHPEAVKVMIAKVREQADANCTAYAAKLDFKTGGNAVRAKAWTLTADPWIESMLEITKPNGEVEHWRTQLIYNHSVYGLPFVQFPTRKVKCTS